MVIDELIDQLVEQGVKSVWFYPTRNSNGSKLFQLLDEYGGELAWRWINDGPPGWRIERSLLGGYSSRPADVVEYDLEQDRLMLLAKDASNGSAPPPRPNWCIRS